MQHISGEYEPLVHFFQKIRSEQNFLSDYIQMFVTNEQIFK